MKTLKIALFLLTFSLSFYSCRESTEMNTDGNMEESETRVEEGIEE